MKQQEKLAELMEEKKKKQGGVAMPINNHVPAAG